MKQNICVFFLLFFTVVLGAQTHESIKTLVTLGQLEKARQEIDVSMTKPEFVAKPEAYILKAYIYSSLANAESKRNTAEADLLAAAADAAFMKYKQMDASLGLLSDALYQNAPVNLYGGYYVLGYNAFTAKNWDAAFNKMKKAVEYSDLLISRNLLPVKIDTNVLILAGIVAENNNKPDEAVLYYSRLADNKIMGEGFESVYRYLVSHYFQKKNYTLFEKYKTLGASLYPSSEFFKYDKVDFAVGLSTSFASQLIAVETILLTEPNDYKANQVLGEIIYRQLHPAEKKEIPANAADLEKKMIAAFAKAATANPGNEFPHLYLGDHFINKAVEAKDDKTCTAVEKAREPYEKVAQIFAARTNLSQKDKIQYKKTASYLADIAACKKVMVQAGTPDAAKYAAEEKKWLALYESIK